MGTKRSDGELPPRDFQAVDTFKILSPPRPKFPSSYIPIINQESELIDNFMESLFEPHEQPEHPGFGDASISQLRDYFEKLDAQIRASYIEVEILQKSLDRAKEAYEQLNNHRRDQWLKFQHKEFKSRCRQQLPLELLSQICAIEYDPFYLRRSKDRWGDLSLAVNRVQIDASRTPTQRDLISKCKNLVLRADHMESIAYACATSDKWTGLMMPLSELIFGRDLDQPTLIFEALYASKRILPALEGLEIQAEKVLQVFRCSAGMEDEVHTCSACTDPSVKDARSVTMPRCKAVGVPLEFLPYIGTALPNLVHLSLQFSHLLTSTPNFVSHFHHVSLECLQTLKIVGKFNDRVQRLVSSHLSGIPALETPALTSLTVVFLHLEPSAVTALLRQLNCPKLKSAILFDMFVVTPTALSEDEHDSEDVTLGKFQEMVKVLHDKCKDLQRLSFYVDRMYGQNNRSQWSQSKPAHMINHVLKTLYDTLIKPEAKLPKLQYLSLPFDRHLYGHETLVEFLQARIGLGHRLRTLEITPKPVYRDCEYKMQRLQLYVDELLLCSKDRNDFFGNKYFPTAF